MSAPNYQDVGAFVDVDDRWELGDERVTDVTEAIERRRALGALPMRRLPREPPGDVASHDSAPREARERRPLPGTVDLHSELRKAARSFLTRAIDETPGCTALAVRLGTARTTAHRWTGPEPPLPEGIVAGTGGPLQAHLHGWGSGSLGRGSSALTGP